MLNNQEYNLKNVLEKLRNEVGGIRANRPTAKLVEDIKVDYLGQKLPIKQLGSISIALPREIQISVWDKNAIEAVAKAIEQAQIGALPSISGKLVRINLPPLSQDRRKELIKIVKRIVENYRIQVRAWRDECNKQIKQNQQATKDEQFRELKKIQEEVDKANEEIEKILSAKIQEIEG